MAASYPSLRNALLNLTSNLHTARQSQIDGLSQLPSEGYLPATNADTLIDQIRPIWNTAKASLESPYEAEGGGKNGESSKDAEGAGRVAKRRLANVNLVKPWMELIGKEVVVSPIANEEVRLLQTPLQRGVTYDRVKEGVVVAYPCKAQKAKQTSWLIGQLVESMDAREQCLFMTTLQDRLDVVLTLYELVYADMAGTSLCLILIRTIGTATWHRARDTGL